jgi:hypothetical protein
MTAAGAAADTLSLPGGGARRLLAIQRSHGEARMCLAEIDPFQMVCTRPYLPQAAETENR